MTFDEVWGKATPNSWARVPRGPVAAAIGSFIFGTTGVMATTTIAGVSLATMTGFLITTAITSWALSALAPKPGSSGSSRGLLANNREAAGAFDIVYGEVRKGGVITFMETTDRVGWKLFKNDFLHTVIVLAGHEVEEIGDIYLNDEVVTLDSNGYVTTDRWRNGESDNPQIRIKKHLGSPTQVADPDLVAETSVTSAFRGRGIAYLYVRMDWDKDVFSSGTPTITAQVKGRKVYDPRTGNTAWTDNAALCIRDYIEQPFGVNSVQSPSSMLSNSWVVGANVSDINVPKKGGGTEKKYTINGVLSTGTTPRENIQKMLTACGGTLFWGQGQWQFKPGYFPSSPYVSLNADDLRSGIDLVTKNSRKENFNAVTGLFVDKAQGYTEVEYPKVSSAVFLARDNGQDNVLDVSLPLTVTAPSAQRLGKMAMFRNREEIVITADFSPKAANVKVGDVVQFTLPRYGFTNKFFEVISWKPVAEDGELKFNLVLKETSAAAYDWNAEEADILGNNTTLPNPLDGLTVSNLSVTNNQVLQKDGTYIGQVTLSWTEADSAFLDKYDVQWKKATDTGWSSTTTDQSPLVIPSIVSGVVYTYRVRAVSSAGFAGPWESISASVIGKDTPPGVPTNLQAEGAYRSVNLRWTNPTDKDLNHVQVWKGDTNNVANATLLGKSGGTNFIDGPITPNVPHYYFVRAVDHTGNFSPFTAGVQGTALFVGNDDVDVDVKELLSDAGLSAVEVLGSLPTTGNTVGRTVYLTTDNTIYTWDGDSWESNASSFDGLLSEVNFPQNLRPIESVNSLPTTGNFKGRVVFLTTNNKLYRHNGSTFVSTTAATDITGTLTTTQIGPNSVTTGNIAAGAITVDQMSANSVTAGAIAANAVTSEKILAGAVLASKIGVGDFTNLVPDSAMIDPAAWTNQNPSQFVLEAAGPVFKSTNWVKTVLASGTVPSGSYLSNPIALEAASQYYFSVQARSSSAIDTMAVWIRINLYNADGSFNSAVAVRLVSDGNLPTGAVTYSGSFTVPSGVTTGRILWSYGTGSVGTAYVGGATVRLKNTGELIVDGAIKANNMSANSVTAGIIAAGAINAAALFVDGVITAAKLNADSLSVAGLAIFGGTLQSNNFNATNGTGWRLTQAGSLIVPNASISRLKIGDNEIFVPYNWDREDYQITTAYNISNKVTFVNHSITQFEGGAFNVSFNADMDALGVDDGCAGFDLLINNSVVRTSRYGANAGGGGGGKVNIIMPIVMNASAYGSSSVNIKVRGWSFKWDNPSVAHQPVWVRNITLTVAGGRR